MLRIREMKVDNVISDESFVPMPSLETSWRDAWCCCVTAPPISHLLQPDN